MLNINKHIGSIKEKYIIVDTPGQIEAFTWSSPGYVRIETLKTIGRVVLVYTVDSVSSHKHAVFMSNMMYCRFVDVQISGGDFMPFQQEGFIWL